MLTKRTLLIALIACCGIQLSALADTPYTPGRLIVQLAEHPRIVDNSDVVLTDDPVLNDALADCWVQDIEPLVPAWREDKHGHMEIDLSLLYLFHFPAELDVFNSATRLSQVPGVVWAEPDYLIPLARTPNDPSFPSQWHLNRIECEAAWDAFEDNSEIVVAVIDTGTEWFHPDLTDNIWVNPGEDLDGDGVVYEYDNMPGEMDEINQTDDDSNNYVDDFIGWDFIHYYNNDCHPSEDCSQQDNDARDYNGHGTHCSGIASAVTDNAVGISSVAWNAKVMGLRAAYHTDDGGGSFPQSCVVNAIYYAVDNGAHIISMSFGGGGGISIRVACELAWDAGLVTVKAGGNDNSPYAPDQTTYAEGIINVAATNSSDHKAMFSNYGSWIDVSAPGDNILSTIPNGGYTSYGGTSMACPLVASLCAYIWALYPDYDNAEVRHHLLHTVDYIYDINEEYEGQLGTGRINAYKAAYGIFSAYITMGDIHLTDDVPGGNGDWRLMPGETAGVWTTLSNIWINPAYNACLTLSTDDPDITITNPVYEFGNIEPDTEVDNEADPILFEIDAGAEPHYSMVNLCFYSDFSDSITYEIPVQIGPGEILIYDFDGLAGDDELVQYYQAGFVEAAVNVDWYDIDIGDFPELNGIELVLSDYAAVLFYTAENDAVIPADVLDGLEGYLAEGGRVLFTGQYLYDHIDDEVFIETYFGCEPSELEVTNRVVYGLPGTVWDDSIVLLQGTQGAGNQQVPYPAYQPTSGIAMMSGETVESDKWVCFGKEDGNWMTMFMAFSLEATGGSTTTSLSEALLIVFADYFGVVESVEQPGAGGTLPNTLSLSSYPNPFNPTTTLRFSLPLAAQVEITIYDLMGRQVELLAAGAFNAGVHTIDWHAADHASGVYFALLQTRGEQAVQKLMLIK